MQEVGRIPKQYELWEIMRDGQNDDIFEVVECNVPAYLGTKIRVVADREYKALVKADSIDDSNADSLVTLYGCFGTAKYIKTTDYRKINVHQAIIKIKNGRTVYVKQEGQYEGFSRYTNFMRLGFDDMSDLLNADFYIREVQ